MGMLRTAWLLGFCKRKSTQIDNFFETDCRGPGPRQYHGNLR